MIDRLLRRIGAIIGKMRAILVGIDENRCSRLEFVGNDLDQAAVGMG
jgi:hypothetical protein